MKIFGINIETKKELKEKISSLILKCNTLDREIDAADDEILCLKHMFPFELGQVVYDIALKNAQGKYAKKNPSFEHCTITEVTVNEKNYFSLKKRYENNDVFFTKDAAEEYLAAVCGKSVEILY